ncbi:MAG: bifunctional (p)ppGpp synthetase/guanosine-3',5'-bis(diphosphate) 3'-pyrophosphohydrolase [Bdellovibrionota bacterium]
MVDPEKKDYLSKIKSEVSKYHPSPDLDLIEKAYKFAEKAHQGQVRASGEPYFYHLAETSLLVCKLKLDIDSIASALLHDTIEDCKITREIIAEEFDEEIADIVEGVTKLAKIRFDSREEKQAESFRKMLLAMAKDIRVVLVKLCDRLHNMRTLNFISPEKQRLIAQETKDIYAPLANRLGIFWLKSELEDLCLKYLRPEIYELIESGLEADNTQRQDYITETSAKISQYLKEAGISAAVSGRRKHKFSVWEKMESKNLSLDEVHDLLGFRIIVPTVRACYEALGVVHSSLKPVPNRFKDYIAMPKPNMYQSLHTTVIGPLGERIELQIRTPEMHTIAEQGIAAHWKYKEGGQTAFDLAWVKDLVETQQYLKNPDEFIQSVKGELFPEEVFVFTPRGDLIRLPFQATPIDFAYAVHSDIGQRTSGAKVNGQIVPLSYQLENGDTVEVITQTNKVPSKDWLDYVKSSKAKQRIRAFLKSEEQSRSMAVGMELLAKDLRKVKQSLKKLEKDGRIEKAVNDLGFKTPGELYINIGYGIVSTAKVLAKILPENVDLEKKLNQKATPLQRIFERAAKASRRKVGVKVSGADDVLVRFAKCCQPLPGDRIVGFITRGRGITIHNANCAQVMSMDPARSVNVRWDTDISAPRKVKLSVHSQDQMGLLAKVTQAITEYSANITSAEVKTSGLGKALIGFEFTVVESRQLDQIIRAIEMVPGVIRVERVRHVSTSVKVPKDKKDAEDEDSEDSREKT